MSPRGFSVGQQVLEWTNSIKQKEENKWNMSIFVPSFWFNLNLKLESICVKDMQLTHCPLHSYFLFLPFKSTSACLTKCNVTFLFPSLHCMRRSLCIFTQAIREWRAGGFIFSAQTANWYGWKGYTWHEEVSRVWHGAKRRYICNRPINEIKVWIGFPVSASFRHALFEWVLLVNESISD